MLDKLLAECGQDVLPFDPAGLTPQKVAGIVNDSGELPGVAGKRGNTYYVVSTGRIEVADTHAVFSPTRGEKIRVAADEIEIDPAMPPAGAPAAPPTVGGTVTTTVTPWGTSATSAATMRTYMITNGIGTLVNFVLALLLMTAGIMVLMNSQRGRRMHLIWAWLKLPAAIGLALVNWLIMKDTMSALATSGTPLPAIMTSMFATFSVVIGLVLACAYPVVLLFVMRSKTINDYYSSVRPD